MNTKIPLLHALAISSILGASISISSVSVAAPTKSKTPQKAKAKPKADAKKPVAPAPKTAAQLQTEYAKKVNDSVNDLLVPLTDVSTNALVYGSKMGKVAEWAGADYMADERQKYAAESEDYKRKIKIALPTVQKQLKQLRAISPVPKSLAEVDKGIGRFCQDAEGALSMIDFGLDQNDFAPVAVGQENLSKAFAVLNKATDELKLRTAPAQQSKKYVDG